MKMNKLLGSRAIQFFHGQKFRVAHLEIWKPSVAIVDIWGTVSTWQIIHLFYELPNSMHDLIEVP
jgi:hypothetical protein